MPKPRKLYAAQRVPNHILTNVLAARNAATLTNAGFGFPTDYVIRCYKDGSPRVGARPMVEDAFIKEAVRIHHTTWIVPILDLAINWMRGTKS